MTIRTIVSVVMLAILGGGLAFIGATYLSASVMMAVVTAGAIAGLCLLASKHQMAMGELDLLRDHLETTRQHAALLARHTRELRDNLALSTQSMEKSSKDPSLTRASEFAVLSALVRDLADSVSDMERKNEQVEMELAEARRFRAAAGRPANAGPGWVAPTTKPAAPTPAEIVARSLPAAARANPPAQAVISAPVEAPMEAEAPRAVRQLVAAAIAADRFDLFLQPVVGLPQRKTRAYDVMLRPDGASHLISNAEIRSSVEAVAHQLAFDRQLLIQTVRLARMFARRERDVQLVVDISQRFLMSEAALDELDALLLDAPNASERIVLSLPQRFYRKAVAFEYQALKTLAMKGFRFMMRDIEDMNIDTTMLAQLGVRWLRMPADRFIAIAESDETVMDVAAADFGTLMSRRGFNFVVDSVNDDGVIAELLDLNVVFAQGLAFSPPRAVRADAMEATMRQPEAPRMAANEAQPVRRGLRDLAKRAMT